MLAQLGSRVSRWHVTGCSLPIRHSKHSKLELIVGAGGSFEGIVKRYREREKERGRRMTARRRFKGGKGRENWVYHRQTRRGSRVCRFTRDGIGSSLWTDAILQSLRAASWRKMSKREGGRKRRGLVQFGNVGRESV